MNIISTTSRCGQSVVTSSIGKPKEKITIFIIKPTWWDFNEQEFQKLVRDSIDKPIFVLCYSPYCAHCHGLPEGFQNYHKGLGNRTDIYITTIDCYNKGGCHLFGIRGTPTITLVLGKRRRYWPISPERGPEGWDRWINERIGPNLRQIYNDSELNAALMEPKDGGTTFLLEVPSQTDPFIEQMRTLSKSYRIYNDTFVFRVNETIEKPVVYAYYSEFCYYTYEGQMNGVKSFVDKYKFGVFHRYDSEEFNNLRKNEEKSLILISDQNPSSSQKNSMRNLPKGRCDKGYIYGWADVKDEKEILKKTGLKSVDLPLIFATGRKGGEGPVVYKGKISKIFESNFLQDTNYSSESSEKVGNDLFFYVRVIIFIGILIKTVKFVISSPSSYNKDM